MTQVSRFDWLPGASAPRGCPMWFVSGDFHFPTGDSLNMQPESRLHAGWGAQRAVDIIGDELKPPPDRLDVLFYSYLEDKFYHGAFPLPRDSILRLLRDGYRSYRDSAGRAAYQFVVVGVAPGGSVAVWLSGEDRQTEVFFGRAEPVDLDWHVALDMPPDVDRREMVQSELTDAAGTDKEVRRMMAHLPTGRWAEYRTRYRWRPTFEGVASPTRPGVLHFFNGERDILSPPPGAAGDQAGRPVPRYLAFDDPRSNLSYEFTFDEEESLAAFARAGAEGRPFELVISVPQGGRPAAVHLRSSDGDVALRNVRSELFRRQ